MYIMIDLIKLSNRITENNKYSGATILAVFGYLYFSNGLNCVRN